MGPLQLASGYYSPWPEGKIELPIEDNFYLGQTTQGIQNFDALIYVAMFSASTTRLVPLAVTLASKDASLPFTHDDVVGLLVDVIVAVHLFILV